MKLKLFIISSIIYFTSFAQINCRFSTHCITGSCFAYYSENLSFLPNDTLFFPSNLVRNKNTTIYYDNFNQQIATIITFDTIHYKINYKHFNRHFKLVKEQEVRYPYYAKDYNTNPLKKKISDTEFVRTYKNDSLVFEAINNKGLLTCKYTNPKTQTHFEKRVYEDCEYTKEYYKNNKLKSICILSYSEEQLMDNGDGIIELFEDCTYFDENGLILNTKK